MSSKLMTILAIGFSLSLAGCIFLAFRLMDMSISYTHLEASIRKHIENADLVSSLLESEWNGISENELLERLEVEVGRRHEDEFVVIDVYHDQGVILLNEVRFEFESGRLNKIVM